MQSAPSRSITSRHPRATLAALIFLGLAGCARLGFTDRVLLRVSSPDGETVAVCQEVPEFDGPGFAVRLERPDGTVVRRLYEIGDADGCSEIAWASDGRTLAVLTAHVARLRFIDVAWAVSHPSVETAHWSWRQVSFAGEGQFVLGKNVHFTDRMEVELQLCPYSQATVRRTGILGCSGRSVTRRVSIPQPIVTGHPVRTAGG